MRRTIFDEEHDMFRESVRSFIDKEIAPNHEKWEQNGKVDKEMFQKAGSTGFLGMAIPEEYGGGGVEDTEDDAPVLLGDEDLHRHLDLLAHRHRAEQSAKQPVLNGPARRSPYLRGVSNDVIPPRVQNIGGRAARRTTRSSARRGEQLLLGRTRTSCRSPTTWAHCHDLGRSPISLGTTCRLAKCNARIK